ncbi:MAG TPA: hypothetical protein VMF89_04470, partial [Polyangiales bacterium]|nr:hypothetical protein [Polyangiales bacterium]
MLLLVGCGQVEDFVPELPDEIADASPSSEQADDAAPFTRGDSDQRAGEDPGGPRDANVPYSDARAQLDAGPARDAGNPPVDAVASDGSATVMDAAVGDAGSGDAAAVDAGARDATADAAIDAGANPRSPTVPAKTGSCPQFVSGDVNFAPAGVATRKVRLWVGTTGGGPLVIYWHSTNNQPIEAENSALAGVITQITAAGGVVAAPYTGANDGAYPWLDTTTESLKIADEIVACAIEVKNIERRRIHAIGFSAGGLMTSTMSFLRSNYLASVVPYSGGVYGSTPAFQNAANKLA